MISRLSHDTFVEGARVTLEDGGDARIVARSPPAISTLTKNNIIVYIYMIAQSSFIQGDIPKTHHYGSHRDLCFFVK